VSWFCRRAPAPPRKPHPDGRVEAQLQRVLSLYAAVTRTEDRIGDIRLEQALLDSKIRTSAGYYSNVRDAVAQAAVLRTERNRLEAVISARHEEAAKLLGELGKDAAFLGGF
jgi:hypothetical protein